MKSILFLVDNFKVFFFFKRIFPGKETKSQYESRGGEEGRKRRQALPAKDNAVEGVCCLLKMPLYSHCSPPPFMSWHIRPARLTTGAPYFFVGR